MSLIYRRPSKLSRKGAQFIGRYEGWRNRPYNDPVGFATIGFGHLLHRSPVTAADNAKWGTISLERGYALLQADASLASASVRRHVKARINQHQHDALVSFVFNVGIGAFESSTLLSELNKHKGTRKGIVGSKAFAELHYQLMRWTRAGGHVLPGLLARRRAEYALFRYGHYR
jgi:lysozyme